MKCTEGICSININSCKVIIANTTAKTTKQRNHKSNSQLLDIFLLHFAKTNIKKKYTHTNKYKISRSADLYT